MKDRAESHKKMMMMVMPNKMVCLNGVVVCSKSRMLVYASTCSFEYTASSTVHFFLFSHGGFFRHGSILVLTTERQGPA